MSAKDSLVALRIAGVGKCYLIREQLIPALVTQAKKVVILAKLRVAAAVAGGDTSDHFAWKHVHEGGSGADVIWVDEISMLDIEMLCELNHASLRDPSPQ